MPRLAAPGARPADTIMRLLSEQALPVFNAQVGRNSIVSAGCRADGFRGTVVPPFPV
jgi:hypothetical protein